VVNWFSIRLTLVLSLIYQWKTRQIDFVLAFPQADVECELYMELPRGLIFDGCHRDTHCLILLKNLYGQKQAGHVWHEYLVEGLIEGHFKQSIVDNCVFYKGSTMLLVYVDDAIIWGPSSKVIDKSLHPSRKTMMLRMRERSMTISELTCRVQVRTPFPLDPADPGRSWNATSV
jgi:hypothetical protein